MEDRRAVRAVPGGLRTRKYHLVPMPSTTLPSTPQTVTFLCEKCKDGPLLYAHLLPNGEVELEVPGERKGTRNRLNDGFYIDSASRGNTD